MTTFIEQEMKYLYTTTSQLNNYQLMILYNTNMQSHATVAHLLVKEYKEVM